MKPIAIHSPAGRTGRKAQTLAPSPGVLAGVRLGVLDNRKPNARLLLTQLAGLIADRTGARVSVVTEKANSAVRCEPDILAKLEAEANVVLTGSAD